MQDKIVMTKTYAKMLENQGYFEDAIKVYKKLYKNNPDDQEIKEALRKYKNVNLKVLEYFVRMEKEENYEKFERWLCKWN